MTTQTPTHVPISALRIDEKANVRKIGRGVTPDFLASIKARGIQLPLIVRPNGNGYVVTDGGKRLAAAQALVADGEWTADAPIPVIVTEATDAEARETSLTLNVVRTAMHPVDEFRAFAALHTNKEQPLDVDAIAARFGIGITSVNQRLALGALADKILDAWRDGQIDEDAARAFTLCANVKEQVRIFDKLKGNVWDYYVKRELKVGANVARALREVGIEAYEKRGGKIRRDLFGDDHAVSDDALLRKMLQDNLDATIKKLQADGWSWVITNRPPDWYSYGEVTVESKMTKEDRAEFKRLQAIMEGDGDDAEEQSDASRNAQEVIEALEEAVELRSYTPAQKSKAGCLVFRDHDGSLTIIPGKVRPSDKRELAKEQRKAKQASGARTTPKTPKGPATLTKALAERLREQRETALKAALVAHPHGNTFAAMLAGIVAAQIRPGSWNAAPDAVKGKFDAMIDAIAPKVMNAAMRKAFDAKGYLEGCGKTFCLAAIIEAVNVDEARKVANKKKMEIAKFAIANVSKTGWLPKELRTSHYDGPAKKAAKKAAAKPKSKKRK